MISSLKLAILGTVLSTTVVAQQLPAVGRLATGPSLITGSVVDVNRAPLAKATVRLRNLQTKEIEQVTVSNAKGEFSFTVRTDIPFIVEIADHLGRTIAVGDIITTQPGDVAATLIALRSKMPAPGSVFGDTAGSVMSALTGAGVTAVQSGVLPVVSPER
jgi:hypothetical protein